MAKHVFEFAYGRLAHCGEIVKETEKTYVVRSPSGSEHRVVKSNGMIVRETDNPKAVHTTFAEKLASYNGVIADAKERLASVQQDARSSAFKAAGLDDPYAVRQAALTN